MFWVAANWQTLPRSLRCVILETLVVCTLLGAWRSPAARMPLALLGFLACGGRFACLGQIYQTGADPWQLFGLWAILTLPLCLGVRHDALWGALADSRAHRRSTVFRNADWALAAGCHDVAIQ